MVVICRIVLSETSDLLFMLDYTVYDLLNSLWMRMYFTMYQLINYNQSERENLQIYVFLI